MYKQLFSLMTLTFSTSCVYMRGPFFPSHSLPSHIMCSLAEGTTASSPLHLYLVLTWTEKCLAGSWIPPRNISIQGIFSNPSLLFWNRWTFFSLQGFFKITEYGLFDNFHTSCILVYSSIIFCWLDFLYSPSRQQSSTISNYG